MSASAPPALAPWVKYVKEATKEGKPFDNKKFWIEVGASYIKQYPDEAYRLINPQIYELLRDNLDWQKIETVLDVGTGFGRILNIMLSSGLLTNVKRAVGLDISKGMIAEANRSPTLQRWKKETRLAIYDFEADDLLEFLSRNGLPTYYDLVISAETMTSIPEQQEERVPLFVNKMCQLSKKYVVNIDWAWYAESGKMKGGKPVNVINTYHDYQTCYTHTKGVAKVDKFKLQGFSEYVFIARLR